LSREIPQLLRDLGRFLTAPELGHAIRLLPELGTKVKRVVLCSLCNFDAFTQVALPARRYRIG